MRILQLLQRPQWRGAELFASQLSNHLQAQGHEVQLVTLFPGESPLPFGGRQVHLQRPASKRLLDLEGWRQLAHLIRDFQPDVVQANAGDTLKFAVGSKLLFRWKAPLVFRNANKVSDFIRSRPQRWYNRLLVNRVAHVISVSELCRQDYLATFRLPAQRVTTIPIGIELQPEPSHPERPADFPEGVPLLLHVGSFVPEKNHAGLLRIADRLRQRDIVFQLALVGEGRLRPWVTEEIQRLGLAHCVKVLGPRPDVPAWMVHARALVLPSLIEGLPGVILEAMHHGLPVIASHVGGISEVVIPQQTGWLLAPADEVGFATAIEEVLKQPPEAMVQRARTMVNGQYDNREIAGRFTAVYQHITAASTRAS
jgi:glycosyltransferase involved in cell wall biosynthesis